MCSTLQEIFFLSTIWFGVPIAASVFEGYDDITSVNEGSCSPAYPRANVTKNFINDLKPEGGFYLPFNSKLEALGLAQAILGRKLASGDDPKDFCLRLDWNTSSNGKVDAGNFIGFEKKTASVSCQRVDEYGNLRSCTVKNKGKLQLTAAVLSTLTDQDTYIVLVICIDKYKMWNVLSTKPKLEEVVTAKIAAHVTELGFDPKNFNVINYSQC